MKKKMRITILCLILAIALMGAGYAAWGRTITDNTSLKSAAWDIRLESDGTFDASDTVDTFWTPAIINSSVTENKVYDVVSSIDGNKFDSMAGGAPVGKVGSNYVYTTAPTMTKTLFTNDTANFKFTNLHPGTSVKTRFEMRNWGTIPAKIGSIDVIVNGQDGNPIPSDDKLYNAIRVAGLFTMHRGAAPEDGSFGVPGNAGYYQLGNFSGKTLAELKAALEAILVSGNNELNINNVSTTLFPQDIIGPAPLDNGGISYTPDKLDCSELTNNSLTFSIAPDALFASDGSNSVLNIAIKFNFVQYNQKTGPAPVQP